MLALTIASVLILFACGGLVVLLHAIWQSMFCVADDVGPE